MCLLTFLPAGITPDTTALRTGAEVNDEGHGFAVVAAGRVVVGRGLDFEQVLGAFVELRAEHLDGPALFHSRLATHGTVSLDNCHPFRLGGDRRTVLAHNGTLPRRVRPAPYNPRSDTRIAAESYLPSMPFGPLDSRRGRAGLEAWLGASKMVVLTVDPAFADTAYILNENAGIWESGTWYSNNGFRADHNLIGRSRTWWHVCEYCGDLDFSRRGRYCGRCGWCFYCANAFPHCDCQARVVPLRHELQP